MGPYALPRERRKGITYNCHCWLMNPVCLPSSSLSMIYQQYFSCDNRVSEILMKSRLIELQYHELNPITQPSPSLGWCQSEQKSSQYVRGWWCLTGHISSSLSFVTCGCLSKTEPFSPNQGDYSLKMKHLNFVIIGHSGLRSWSNTYTLIVCWYHFHVYCWALLDYVEEFRRIKYRYRKYLL